MWGQHVRWSSWKNYVNETPLSSLGLAVPQGGPFGPLIVAQLRCSICQQEPPIIQSSVSSIYMDDRTFVYRSAQDLKDHCDMWKSWSRQVGLQESDHSAFGAPAKRILPARTSSKIGKTLSFWDVSLAFQSVARRHVSMTVYRRHGPCCSF